MYGQSGASGIYTVIYIDNIHVLYNKMSTCVCQDDIAVFGATSAHDIAVFGAPIR